MPILVSPVWAEGGEGAVGDSWIQAHLSTLDARFGDVVALLETFLFADLGTGVPLIVVLLLLGGIYYSFYFGWLSFRGFRHAIDVIRGRYDDPDGPGEISHFQALTSALSATVGLGNIAGVAIVKPFLVEKLLENLRRAPLEACSVREVKGYGRQKSYLDQYSDSEYSLAFLPKVEVTLWVEDARSEEIVRKI
ncbi:MAG TPA: hypothetical protein EYO90_02320, partial [Candidatus Latescibacteria bacterium]|nr:hypothetical protein [Candidatus Latescibacterota bacterium]